VCSGAPDHAGMVGTYLAGKADPGITERRASRARRAGCALIFPDASDYQASKQASTALRARNAI